MLIRTSWSTVKIECPIQNNEIDSHPAAYGRARSAESKLVIGQKTDLASNKT